MLEKGVFEESGPEPEWRVELQRMLMLNIKAEIQIMCMRDDNGLESLIRHGLKQLACGG
jgi:meiotic recombination protein SPO11